MKRLIKILLIVIASILLVALVTPFIFKGKIMQVAREQINNNINAKVDFSNLNLSFIKNFPNASIVLKNLIVSGINEFETDTLLKLKAFDIRVDLISAIKMENINIKGILIDEPEISARVLADGKANWDIVKEPAEEEEEEIDTTATEFTTKISLKKFEIRDAMIKYIDESSNMSASLEKFNFILRGDMSQDFTTLSINSHTAALNFIMEGIRYVNQATLSMNINLDADLKNSIYILKENNIDLNELSLGFEGSIEMPNETDIKTDMKFATKKTDFKSLLSLVPAIYMQDFQDVKTTGSLMLGGHVKGTYNSEQEIIPNASLKLKVENAMFKYPDLPKSADNIQIDIDLNYDGVAPNNSTIDINKFHIDLGGNPIDLTMNIKTPESDMNLNGIFKADLDLATLSDVIPLEDVTLKGTIKSNIDFMGFMSYIENEEYEKFKADGFVQVTDFIFNSPDMPKAFKINESSVQFSPKYVQVSSFDAEIGNSDMAFAGRLENFIPYIFNDETIKGDFKFASNVLDLNEFMTETEESVETTEDTAALSVIEIPGNIDFRLDARIEKIFYDKLVIDKTQGIIVIRDGKAKLENLDMKMLEGSMLLNGEYNTQNVKSPMADFRIKADSIDIPSAFRSFEVLGKLAPVAKSATGKVSLDMGYTSFLDEQMSPVVNTIVGKGSFSSNSIALLKSPTFAKLGDVLKTKAFDKMSLGNLKVDFEIRNGRIYIDPFETKMGAGNLVIAGDQGIDQTMNYNMNINMPRSLLGSGANDAINKLYANAALKGLNISPSENINMNVKVGGTFTAPNISVDLKDNVKQSAQAIKEEIKEKAKEEIDKKKEEAKAIAGEQAQKIIAEAEAQAEKIKEEAARLADLTRSEANANADKLVNEATNPIAKKAAEITAKKIRQQGEDKAQLIVREADEKANKIISEARERADKLTQ
ncbi:MAG: AsmA family protein [Bacteroidales bacterium]|nr:AsmA family protein [Bacteroidales bacterium]